MLNIRNSFIVIFLLLFFHEGFAQATYPTSIFRSPVDFPIQLSGTFAELRDDHFHSGIDIKTGGVSGKPIYSIGEGYVSRVKVSPYGFGNAIYVTHPEGFVSVYAHLDHFSDAVQSVVFREQYKRKRFAVDLPLRPGLIQVKKGEVIARSGNSGSSAGPHLHFEIRDLETQRIINPLHFGFPVKDFIRPKICGLMVYPESNETTIDGKAEPVSYSVEGWGLVYRPQNYHRINVSGPFSLGICTYDLLNDAPNKNGVYRLELLVNGDRIWQWTADDFSFSETGYINSFIDYSTYSEQNRRYIRTAIDPNNRLSMYAPDSKSGVIFPQEGKLQSVFLRVFDFSGDTSLLTMEFIASKPLLSPQDEPKQPVQKIFHWDTENQFETDSVAVHMIKGSLFRDMNFTYSNEPLPEGITGFSALHHIGQPDAIAYLNYSLSIVPDSLPLIPQEKLCLAIYNNGKVSYAGGTFKDGRVHLRTRKFGHWFITADTTAPQIRVLNSNPLNEKGKPAALRFFVKDDFSGVASYNAYVNDQ